MKIRTTRRTEINGRPYQKYATVEVDTEQAKQIIDSGNAVEAEKKIEPLYPPKKYFTSGNKVIYDSKGTSLARKVWRQQAQEMSAVIIAQHWPEIYAKTGGPSTEYRVAKAKRELTKQFYPWLTVVNKRTKMPTTACNKAKEIWDAALNELSVRLLDEYIPQRIVRTAKGKIIKTEYLT